MTIQEAVAFSRQFGKFHGYRQRPHAADVFRGDGLCISKLQQRSQGIVHTALRRVQIGVGGVMADTVAQEQCRRTCDG